MVTKDVRVLKNFITYINDGVEFHPWSASILGKYIENLRQISKEFFTNWEDPDVKEGRILRASTLGQPSVVQAMKVLGYDNKVPGVGTENRLSRLFMDGHVFEAEIIAHMEAYPGFSVVDQQREIEFEGVFGHIDGVVDTGHGKVLIEAKTMSPYYFDKFIKEPNDVRGYVTQLAIYTEALGLPGVWICKNKATSQVAMVIPNEEELVEARYRAHLLVPLLRKIETFEDIFEVFQAPEPVEEVCKKKATGRFLVPEEMRYNPWRYVFYDITKERNCYSKYTEYAIQLSSMEHAREKLDVILEELNQQQV